MTEKEFDDFSVIFYCFCLLQLLLFAAVVVVFRSKTKGIFFQHPQTMLQKIINTGICRDRVSESESESEREREELGAKRNLRTTLRSATSAPRGRFQVI